MGATFARLPSSTVSADLRGLATSWRQTLAAHPANLPAGRRYIGRSISEARTSAETVRAKLWIVSAGLGLVAEEELVPGYDLTAAGGGPGLPALLKAHGASVADWWREITNNCGISHLLDKTPNAVVLLALPSDYLRMLSTEFAMLSVTNAARLRVFTSVSGRAALAHRPDVPIMPYDERLEGLTGFAGTRADFPQRALRHFVERLSAHGLDVEAARRGVEQAMAACYAPKVPLRRRLPDDEICALIRAGWAPCGGNSARLLRYVRDDNQVACEQSRFAALRRRVAPEFAGNKLPFQAETMHVVEG